MSKKAFLASLVVATACSLSAPLMADPSADKAAQAAAAKAQFMLRQVSSEKSALEVKNQELQKQIDALTKKAQVMEKEQKVSELGKEKMSDQISGIKEKYAALVDKYNELREAYINEKKNNQKAELKMEERDGFIKQCVENNKKLFTINQEILGKYEHKGFWDVMNQKEPFTGLSQVDIENLVQDYQFKNEDARVNEKMVPVKDAPKAADPDTAAGQ
jgi:hypothetical protein